MLQSTKDRNSLYYGDEVTLSVKNGSKALYSLGDLQKIGSMKNVSSSEALGMDIKSFVFRLEPSCQYSAIKVCMSRLINLGIYPIFGTAHRYRAFQAF